MRAILSLMAFWWSLAGAVENIDVGHFSKARAGATLPEGWRTYHLADASRATEYSLARVDGRIALRAQADASASALIHPLRADPAATPWLTWEWRVDTVLDRADASTREGDDFPARIYVLFDYDRSRLPLGQRARVAMAQMFRDEPLPLAVLCYVWDNRHAPGASFWSAYSDRVRIIVVRSGSRQAGSWVRESRDIAQDFREAFGELPPVVTGIVVAADTDNTGERSVAYFGDISLSRQAAGR
jgi:hypothetical protein